MIEIPPIPEGPVTWPDQRWIAVKNAVCYANDLLAQYGDRMDVTARRNSVFAGQPVAIAKCEVCDLPVEKGNHHRRGWGLWVHAGCAVKVRDFLAKLTPPAPAPYVEEVEYADF